MRVFVYWNLHKGMWSVKALEGPDKGRVVARTGTVHLTNVSGKVSQAGRERVLREGKKNVHAGLVGDLVTGLGDSRASMIASVGDTITYNPRKYTSFVHTVDESQFEGAAWAVLTADRRVYVA